MSKLEGVDVTHDAARAGVYAVQRWETCASWSKFCDLRVVVELPTSISLSLTNMALKKRHTPFFRIKWLPCACVGICLGALALIAIVIAAIVLVRRLEESNAFSAFVATGGQVATSIREDIRAHLLDFRNAGVALSRETEDYGYAMFPDLFHTSTQAMRYDSERHWGVFSYSVNISDAERAPFEAFLSARDGTVQYIKNASAGANAVSGYAPYYFPVLHANTGNEILGGFDTSRPGIDVNYAGSRDTVTRARDEGRVIMDTPSVSSFLGE